MEKLLSMNFPEQTTPVIPNATTHLFEIPWNGDAELITKIYESPYRDHVKFVYLPCVDTHGVNTRRTSRPMVSTELFEAVVDLIRACGFEPSVLIQRRFNTKYLSYYYDLGIHYFTVGEDSIAKEIRGHLGNDVYLTASITKDLMSEDYQMYAEKFPDLYDIFILRYGFSRDIESLMDLPKNLKYGLIPNTTCLWNCPVYRTHWFPWEGDLQKFNDFNCKDFRDDPSRLAIIYSTDLWLFDPYITSYKLIDRTDKTDIIFQNLVSYASCPVISQDTVQTEIFNHYNIAHNMQKPMLNPIY